MDPPFVDGAEDTERADADVMDVNYSPSRNSPFLSSGRLSSADDPSRDPVWVPPATEPVVISDGDGEDDLEIQQVRRITAEDIRKQRMEAARAALRRAANAAPRRPPQTKALLSTFRCSICLSPPQNVCVTPCGHMFCGACLYDALAMQTRQHGHEWSENDWLGVMGDPNAGRQMRGSNLFTPFGSGGALALANAAGVSASPARELFSELVSQRQSNENNLPSNQTAPVSASRLRANNGTGKLRGHCPVCRTTIHGGFTGPSRRGILGLDIMVGTPSNEPQPLEMQNDRNTEADCDTACPVPSKRTRVQ